MGSDNFKIKSFSQLIAWQKGHELVMNAYNATKDFPKEELFCLTNQMRRCAISVTSNIAEGFSQQSMKEKKQFYSMSLGSLTELQNQLVIARDLNYINKNFFNHIAKLTIEVSKLINGLKKSAQNIAG